MARQSESIVPSGGSQGELVSAPDYLDEFEQEGLEGVKDHVRPERIKVVQKQSATSLVNTFGIGGVVLMPSLIPICTSEEHFLATPLFYYTEYLVWNPLEMQESLPAIRERTFDEKDPIARICKDPNKREQACPENPDLTIRYQEHLNFILFLPEINGGTVAVASFSRAEYTKGEQFCSRIFMRKKPIWSGVYQFNISERPPRRGGTWFGFDITNPDLPNSPWITQENVEAYRNMHLGLEEAHKKHQIIVDYEDDLGGLEETAEASPADSI